MRALLREAQEAIDGVNPSHFILRVVPHRKKRVERKFNALAKLTAYAASLLLEAFHAS